MTEQTRRSLIIAAGLAAVAPKLVRAESLVDIPWNMRAAQRWATETFNENPGCRLIFSDGTSYKWFVYQHLHRTHLNQETAYAVAIEVAVTDAKGRRTINTTPVDGYALTKGAAERASKLNAELARDWWRDMQ